MLRKKSAKILSMMLCLVLLISSMPVTGVFAAGETDPRTYDFTSSYIAGAVTVDGVIDEAAWNVNLGLNQGIVEGTTNSSAKFGTLWDLGKLYIAFDVTDSSIVNSNSADGPWEDDSVEVYIDGNNSKTYDSKDAQYIFRWYDSAGSSNEGNIFVYNNSAANMNGIEYVTKVKEDGSGYVAEISIPWSCINGLAVNPGDVIGFTAHLNDRDDDGLGTSTSVTHDYLGYTPDYNNDWQSAANWAEMTLSPVIFNDDCSNIASSGWTVSGTAKTGGYITDNTRSTGETVEGIKAVDAGQYLFYGDATGGGADQALYRLCNIGSGAWELQFDANFVSLMSTKPGYEIYRGFLISIFAGGRSYLFTMNDNKINARTGSSAIPVEVTLPSDGQLHKWTIKYDGTSKVIFAIDGTQVAAFDNISGDASTVPDLVKLHNESEDLVSGYNEIYFDNIKMVMPAPEDTTPDNVLVNDDCSGISAAGWSVSGGSGTAILNDTERAGSYYLYSDASQRDDSTKKISKTIELSPSEKWSLDMDMQIDKLRLINDIYKGYYGIDLSIANGERLIRILMTQDGVSVNQSDGYIVGTVPFPSGIIGDGKYHKISFYWDGVKDLIFAVDGVKVGTFTGMALASTSKYFSITSDNYMAGDGTAPFQPSGEQKAYIDNISLVKNFTPQWALHNSKIKFVNILPESDASGMEAMVVMEDIPEDMIGSDAYEVRVDVYMGDVTGDPAATAVSPVQGERFLIGVPGVAPDTLYKVKASLVKKPSGIIMNSYVREFQLDASVNPIEKDGILSGKQGDTYLYTDVKAMAEITHNWMAGTYTYDGTNNKDYIESKDNAGTISLPVAGAGKYAIYVGYLNGTEEFNVNNSKVTSNIIVVPKRDRTSHSETPLYGARSMSEVFATVVDFSAGETFSLTPVNGAYARIAYIKLKPMTDADAELWNRQSDGIKRLVYNNDGYSDFYMGYYSEADGSLNIQNLLNSAINRYAGKSVDALDWSLGGTLTLNQPSQYCSHEIWDNIYKVMTGRSNEITDPVKRQEAKEIWVRLRSGDELAVRALLAYIDNNLSPLQLLEKQGDQLGIDVNVSIRMEAFYDPAGDDRWANGADYSKYVRTETANGSKRNEISLADVNFQDYIINILKESVTKYGADGVNLDFDRYPYVLGYELADYGYDVSTTDKLYAAKRDVVNKFMRRVRAELPEGTVISARIPVNEFGDQFGTGRGYRDNGLDFETWTMEGLIDVLIPCDISYEEFHSIAPFTEAVNAAKEAGKNVTLYCGITNDLGGHDLTKDEEDLINQGVKIDTGNVSVSVQQYRLRALEAFNAGAERIYVFNDWKGSHSLDYIGDKVALEKWYGLAYESESVQNLANVSASADVGDTYVPPVVDPPVIITPIPTPEPTVTPTPTPTPTPAANFTDLDGSWAKDEITKLANAGILNGYSDGTVRPDANATRAEFVNMLMKLVGLEAKTTASFNDTVPDAWYMKAVSLAAEAGWVNGRTDGSFGPNDNITREEAFAIISRFLDGLGVTASNDSSVLDFFKDASEISAWAKADTAKLVGLGIVKGSQGRLNPRSYITRAEISAIICRVMDIDITK